MAPKPIVAPATVRMYVKRLDHVWRVLTRILPKFFYSQRTSTHERAEDVGKNPEFREQYDFATARAVAPLNVLCEYCMPLVKVGGRFVSLKGSNGLEELEAAKNAIMVLGGELEAAESYVLPNGDGRTIFVIKKISQTPTKYPRKPKKIDTRPL